VRLRRKAIQRIGSSAPERRRGDIDAECLGGHFREKFSCRDCEAITEAPAPSHPIPRGFAGPSLLAMVLVNKFLLHQPLNRQSKTYAREGVEIDVSTLADRIGACVVALDPIIEAIRTHVMSAERIHADDTTVPVVCTENPDIMVMKSAKGGMRFDASCRLDRARNRRILVQGSMRSDGVVVSGIGN
jgi:hypothetical protein